MTTKQKPKKYALPGSNVEIAAWENHYEHKRDDGTTVSRTFMSYDPARRFFNKETGEFQNGGYRLSELLELREAIDIVIDDVERVGIRPCGLRHEFLHEVAGRG